MSSNLVIENSKPSLAAQNSSEALGQLNDSPENSEQNRNIVVNGESYIKLPDDLYIPPDALEVFLEQFSGPLDLLLYLIRRANFNILDIPMADLTRQYMAYIESMQVKKLELAAEYLLMAAMLIEIKSRMLLPKPALSNDDSDEDPRAELVRRLVEYEQIKLAAFKINQLDQAERDFLWTSCQMDKIELLPPQLSLNELAAVWRSLQKREQLFAKHTIVREELSVREHMSMILLRLRDHQQEHFIFINLLNDTADRASLVVNFVAVLELVKEQLLDVSQVETFSPIYLSLKKSEPITIVDNV